MRKEAGVPRTVTIMNADGGYAEIVPSWGGAVQGLELRVGKGLLSLIERNDDAAAYKRWFRGAKLLPFPNRVKDGRYDLDGRRQLPINFPLQQHAIHGLLYNKRMRVIRKSAASITLGCALRRSPGYPFDLRISLRYRITSRTFSCMTSVENIGKTTAPFGDGWHPYFTLGPVGKLFLRLPNARRILVDQRMIPTGRTAHDRRFETPRRIACTKFDTGFVITANTKRAVTSVYDQERRIALDIWQDMGKRGYSFVQVFIPPSRRSIAIEPMTCAADAFNNHCGIIMLEPGERWKKSYGVVLNALQ